MPDASEAARPPGDAPPPVDAGALMRSRRFRWLLLASAVVGVVVSIVAWAFLELLHALQEWVYTDAPRALGLDPTPWWWPLPVLAVAGLLIAVAVERLPGNGGHEPSEGLRMGAPTRPVDVPGVVLAAMASIGLGLVLGPEAPLIALGTGVALALAGLSRRPLPGQAQQVIGAAAAFAALATIFGSPVVGAVVIIEAAGLGGAMLPVILLPGLVAAGIGSLVFVGIGSLTGLNTNAYALPPLSLPHYPTPTVTDFLWTIALAAAMAVLVFGVVKIARWTRALVERRRFLLGPAAAVAVGLAAVVFAEMSGQSPDAVLFSGQDAMLPVIQQSATLSLGTLALLAVCKAVAWGISLGAARGGPTFPAIFLGLVAGLLASHLPGFAETPAVGALVGAAVVAMLRLPLSAIVITLLLTQAGGGVAPLVIVAVVVAYIVTLLLSSRRPGRATADPGSSQVRQSAAREDR